MAYQTQVGMALNDFMAQYDEAAFELVDGERIPLVPAVVRHGLIIKAIYRLLLDYEREYGTIEVFSELPFVLVYNRDWVTGSRTPDLIVYKAERLAEYRRSMADYQDKPFVIVPDLCVEVISPNDSYQDVDDKVDRYLADGVRMVWVINPRNRTIAIYTPDSESVTRLGENSILTDEDVLPDLSIPLKAIFQTE